MQLFSIMLKLFLLRHGKATKFIDEESDFMRPLNKQGTAQVNQIGYLFRQTKTEVHQIISSDAQRTVETAEIVNFYLKLKQIEFKNDLYLANYGVIMHQIGLLGKGKNLLYVGHNNGISDLASYLTGKRFDLSTSHLVEIHFDLNSWQEITKDSGTFANEIIPEIHSF